MKILTINCGSSTVKYALFSEQQEIARGIVVKIGKQRTYRQALEHILFSIIKKKRFSSTFSIDAVGHRVVHGGKHTKSVIITPAIIRSIEKISLLAPLHNPHNLEGIYAVQQILPKSKQVAVFDTAFHTNIPAHASVYAIPFSIAKKYAIQRYGFHGISYQYICTALKEQYKILPKKLIICHLGNGSSIAAIKNGKCIDTSMGFTPMEGLIMGTRSGDIDPGIVLRLAQELGIKRTKIILNNKSGLNAFCGTQDMEKIWKSVQEGNNTARDAVAIYCYRIQKYIGAYSASLGGVDALVFTAGIGEHAWWVRELVCRDLKFLGIRINTQKNKLHNNKISSGKTGVYVIPTNEERMIAEETNNILSQA